MGLGAEKKEHKCVNISTHFFLTVIPGFSNEHVCKFILLTPAILVRQIGEAPDVAEANSISNHGENVVTFFGPGFTLFIVILIIRYEKIFRDSVHLLA